MTTTRQERKNTLKGARLLPEGVSERNDDADAPEHDDEVGDEVDDMPRISCSRCGQEWDLGYELDELRVGNQAVEQFALDHRRHTGHFPDDISTWLADCLQCPEETERLHEDAARRWGQTHARHTRHSVEIRHATDGETTVIDGEE